MQGSEGRRPIVYTVSEVADFLGLEKNRAYLAVHAGEIPSIRLGHRLLIPAVVIEEMLNITLHGPREEESSTDDTQPKKRGGHNRFWRALFAR